MGLKNIARGISLSLEERKRLRRPTTLQIAIADRSIVWPNYEEATTDLANLLLLWHSVRSSLIRLKPKLPFFNDEAVATKLHHAQCRE
jgi:hypothetical protein